MIVMVQIKNILNEHIKMSKKGALDVNQTTLKNMANSEENKDIFVRIVEKHLRT